MKRVFLVIGFWLLSLSAIAAQAAVFSEDFESGQNGWSADNGIWEVGSPSNVGPAACFGGAGCAGTNLSGNYPNDGTDSRLISPSIVLPAVSGAQQLHLRFREWHQYAVASGENDRGQVQVSVWDPVGLIWSAWQSTGSAVNASSPVWSVKAIDLTPYAGQKIRLAFYHIDDIWNGDWSGDDVAAGLYIDDVSVVVEVPPELTDLGGDFEAGWGQWVTDNGVWEVGLPSAGPAACHSGNSCAGTILNANYPNTGTDSKLFSPELQLPSVTGFEEIHLRFWEWHRYAVASGEDDRGQVQISVWDPVGRSWSAWQNIGEPVRGSSTAWTMKDIDLTAYSGKNIYLAFYHIDDIWGGDWSGDDVAAGWYIDDIAIVVPPPPPVPPTIVQSIGLTDLNANGADEVATLILDNNSGAMEVWIRDGANPAQLSVIDFGVRQGAQAPLALAEVPDLDADGKPEIAVLIKNDDKTVDVVIRDAVSGGLIKKISFGKIAAAAKSLVVLADSDGNGIPEVGVLRGGKSPLVKVRDTLSGQLVRTIPMP